jgi:hypothetical protein
MSWSSVIRDLLLISPNAHLRQSLPSMTATDLQRLAIDYFRFMVQTSESSPRCQLTYTRPMNRLVKDITLIPGTPFMIWVSGTATVHLMNMQTGCQISFWEPSKPIHKVYQVDIEIWDCESTNYACVFLVSVGIVENR